MATVATLTLAATSVGVAVAAQAAQPTRAAKATVPKVRPACAASDNPDVMSCFVLVRTDIKQRSAASFGFLAPTGYGFGPSELQSAYNLPSSTDGAGESVAVVDAYDDPTAVSDVATYRSAWGLPACDPSTEAGCLTKVNDKGQTSPLPAPAGHSGWATEESLDVDMVSAICPKCHIYLVEASGASNGDLGTAVDAAVKVLHVKYVSNSYGGRPKPGDPSDDTKYFDHPGVAVVASAGDSGYGTAYPAASRYRHRRGWDQPREGERHEEGLDRDRLEWDGFGLHQVRGEAHLADRHGLFQEDPERRGCGRQPEHRGRHLRHL